MSLLIDRLAGDIGFNYVKPSLCCSIASIVEAALKSSSRLTAFREFDRFLLRGFLVRPNLFSEELVYCIIFFEWIAIEP